MKKSLSSTELRKILETVNERDLFLVGHMYIENTIDRILEKKFNIPSESIDNTLFTTNLKMDILTESGLIKGKIKKKIEKLARIRNRYAHKIEPTEQKNTNYNRELDYLGPAPKIASVNKKFEKYRLCANRTFSGLDKILKK